MNHDRRPVTESRPEDWRSTLEVNLFGAYYCAQAVIPHLQRRGGGKILTIGSGIGHRGRAGSAAYACSKAGVWMLTRVLAQELWQYNISVNERIPGPVETPRTAEASVRHSDTVFAIDSEWIKAPEDVVPLALFLATQPAVGPTAQSCSLRRRDNEGRGRHATSRSEYPAIHPGYAYLPSAQRHVAGLRRARAH